MPSGIGDDECSRSVAPPDLPRYRAPNWCCYTGGLSVWREALNDADHVTRHLKWLPPVGALVEDHVVAVQLLGGISYADPKLRRGLPAIQGPCEYRLS